MLVAKLAAFEQGTWVRTPCYGITILREVSPVGPVDVLLDPGHGGSEDGAVGHTGLKEKDLDLIVSERARTRLQARGRSVAMTRDSDIRQPIRTRAELATALRPRLFVSIHHNALGPPPRKGRPGSEVFYQSQSDESKRLAQELWDELTVTLGRFDIEWSADDEHVGPKSRLGEHGDYYGVLRYSEGVPAVITEAAFITSKAEAELMATEAFRDAEADAIASAIDQYLVSPARPGTTATSGTTPESTALTTELGTVPGSPPRLEPATTTTTGLPAKPPDVDDCVDPPLE